VRAFYYDLVCPYAYIAFMRFARDNIFVKNNIELKPILLGGLFKLMGQEPDLTSCLPKIKKDYIRQDILRQAQLYKVPLKFHPDHPLSSPKALRLLYACEPHLREKLSLILYKAYWQEQRDLNNEDFIADLKKDFGIDALDDAKELLINATAEAFSLRVFGVPTLLFNKRLYFGSDRLELIHEDLGIKEVTTSWTPGTHLDFYFDFTSPYSYLAYLEIEKALEHKVHINFKPILLGALFKEMGQQGAPMLAAHPHKAAYYLQDMQDWAQARKASFIFNQYFPIRSINALRIALVDPQAIGALFRAAWVKNLNIGDDLILQAVLEQAGFKSAEIIAQSQSLEIKEKLKNQTAEALSLGVFGVPFFALKSQLVFGQDRFRWLKYELALK